MAIIITNNPILDARDLASLQSASNRDPRTLVNVLATLVRKIGAWKLVAESIVLTDGSGRKLGEFGDNITVARNMKVNVVSSSLSLTLPLVADVVAAPGNGVLRKIAIRVSTGVTGTPRVLMKSAKFASDIPIYYDASTFVQAMADKASRLIGTGANAGDMLLLDGMAFEFSGGLSITLSTSVGHTAATGVLEISAWYDSM